MNKSVLKVIIILFFIIQCNFDGISQNNKYVEISFLNEIKQGDTCFRFFNVKHFNNKSKNDWFSILEYIHNVVLILPNDKNWKDIDEETKKDTYYTSSCINVIFYCIDNNSDILSITYDNLLKNNLFKKKIILKFNYINGKLIVDPFNFKIYKNISF